MKNKYLPIKENIINKNDKTLTVLLGFSKYMFHNFKYNNVQVTGDYYLDDEENLDALVDVISDFNPMTINLIGTSKSGTGAFIYTKVLKEVFKSIKFRIFAFSSYTTIDKDFYERNDLMKFIPPSLSKIWDNKKLYTPQNIKLAEAKELVDIDNISIFLIYPNLSRGGEPLLAKRVDGLNTHHIELHVQFHSVIFAFWKKISHDSKVELFEGQFKVLPPFPFEYFKTMQNYTKYKFDIYSLINDTDSFIAEMKNFNKDYIG